MTSLIKNKILIPVKIKNKHIDPPGLWIAVAVTSVSLHLLVIFWLLRSSSVFGFGFSPSGHNAVPIEFIELASQPKSIIKSIPKTTVVVSKPPKIKTKLQPKLKPAPQLKSQTPLIGTVSSESSPKPTLSNKPKSQLKPTPKTSNTPKFSLTPTPKTSNTPKFPLTPTPKTSNTPKFPLKPTPSPPNSVPTKPPFLESRGDVKLKTDQSEKLPTDSPEKTSTEGKLIAKMAPLLKKEVNELIQEGRLKLKPKDLPEFLGKYEGSLIKKVKIPFLNNESEPQPVKILASLVIDKNGKFLQSEVLETEPQSFMSQKNIYEQALNGIFKIEKFSSGYNQDGSKPEQSNLFINITIQLEAPK